MPTPKPKSKRPNKQHDVRGASLRRIADDINIKSIFDVFELQQVIVVALRKEASNVAGLR
jgi:hypothetical protein